MAVKVKNNKGRIVTLLNPSEKASKYAYELKNNIRTTNDGRFKPDKNGDLGLSDTQRSYRSGYLQARKDSANAFKSRKK